MSSARDFDFLIGEWRIANRRRTAWFRDCDEWETFEATSRVRALPGGIGNCDDFTGVNWRPGFVGMTLRVWNPATQLWSLYWLSNRDGGLDERGVLRPPVVGAFRDGEGVFEGRETFDGRPAICRFRWHDLAADQARWSQSMSIDDGATWELNWEMALTRTA